MIPGCRVRDRGLRKAVQYCLVQLIGVRYPKTKTRAVVKGIGQDQNAATKHEPFPAGGAILGYDQIGMAQIFELGIEGIDH